MREIDEPADVDDPAWPELERMLPASPEEGRRCLLQMQVTARSTLGAIALNTGGLLARPEPPSGARIGHAASKPLQARP